MIQIKPLIEHKSICPYCKSILANGKILWQGIHTIVNSKCICCGAQIFDDLKVGQAIFTPFQIGLKDGYKLFGEYKSSIWFGEPLLNSLKNPKVDFEVKMSIERKFDSKNIVVLNCIDFLYGHSLLKMLNADSYIIKDRNIGLVVIVPKFLRWMVPKYVAEIWTVNIPLSKAQNYYPRLNDLIQNECNRFDTIYLSLAHSHPILFDITNFTGVKKHNFNAENFRITYIWREDRLWISESLFMRFLNKFKVNFMLKLMLYFQNYKIRKIFSLIRKSNQNIKFTVCGSGTRTKFPNWIDDQRTDLFSDVIERKLCLIYSESRLVIGVHGSNMLLPSAHAGMILDLMPKYRWGNFAEDVLYQNNSKFGNDERMISWKYRYLPIDISLKSMLYIMKSMIYDLDEALQYFEV